jgi:hypothetical protein
VRTRVLLATYPHSYSSGAYVAGIARRQLCYAVYLAFQKIRQANARLLHHFEGVIDGIGKQVIEADPNNPTMGTIFPALHDRYQKLNALYNGTDFT